MNDFEAYCYINILNRYNSGESYLKPIINILHPKFCVYLLTKYSLLLGGIYEKK